MLYFVNAVGGWTVGSQKRDLNLFYVCPTTASVLLVYSRQNISFRRVHLGLFGVSAVWVTGWPFTEEQYQTRASLYFQDHVWDLNTETQTGLKLFIMSQPWSDLFSVVWGHFFIKLNSAAGQQHVNINMKQCQEVFDTYVSHIYHIGCHF